jgi:hypothetical protein
VREPNEDINESKFSQLWQKARKGVTMNRKSRVLGHGGDGGMRKSLHRTRSPYIDKLTTRILDEGKMDGQNGGRQQINIRNKDTTDRQSVHCHTLGFLSMKVTTCECTDEHLQPRLLVHRGNRQIQYYKSVLMLPSHHFWWLSHFADRL